MTNSDYQQLDGVALANLLRTGATTPVELMTHAINLAQTRGQRLNALCFQRYEESQQRAAGHALRGAFAGLPFLLKDSSLASTRFPLCIGSRLFDGTTATVNATLTDRFEAAGFIAFARTTTPEFCMAPATEALVHGGPTLNPWAPEKSCGGSSGGAAVSVASRIVPIAHGSDGGGSIRIPASCCGVFGLKPTRGRVPVGPAKGEIWGGLGTDGVLSRSVRDSAVALDAIAGRDMGAPYGIEAPTQSFASAAAQEGLRPLRIGVWRTAWNAIDIAPQCLEAVEYTARLCRELGHDVVEAPLPELDYETFFQHHMKVLAANIAMSTDNRLKVLGRGLLEEDLEYAMRDGYETGRRLTSSDYIAAIDGLHHVARVMQGASAPFDLILTPMLTQLPVPLGYLSMHQSFVDLRTRIARYATFAAVFNASGQPAASVPVYWTPDNVPVGIQLVGQFGREDVILSLSAQLERAAPWAKRTPSFDA